jgi:hypothetical protein
MDSAAGLTTRSIGAMLSLVTGTAMPDLYGRLTQADNDAIQRWWAQHWKPPVICPVCKTSDWILGQHVVNIQRHAIDVNAINTPTYPHIMVSCKVCAHTMFFNAVTVGVSPVFQETPAAPPPLPPSALATALGLGALQSPLSNPFAGAFAPPTPPKKP